jgi:uncharacterized DUF497 family protein
MGRTQAPREHRQHGFDFTDLTVYFLLNAHVGPARHGRLKAIGVFESQAIVVIFAPLGREGWSVISMRPAKRKERRLLP